MDAIGWIGIIVVCTAGAFVLGMFYGFYIDDRQTKEAQEWAEFRRSRRA